MKKFTLIALFGFGSVVASAQDFAPALNGTSHSKTSYVTLTDGTVIEGTIKGLKRKKGLLEDVKIEDASGKKLKFTPDEIKFMYLPPSNLAKLSVAVDKATTVSKWDDDSDFDKDILSKGYVYFEQAPVMIKKKTKPMLMQLLNPSFSGKVKVYDDPFAKETASLGVGGLDVVGGDKKSYYILKDDVAYRIYKKDYKKEYKSIFQDCSELMSKLDQEAKWTEFAKHIYEYTNTCK